MGKTKNCPNCGAPYEYDKVVCPYCKTAYYDMSFLNLDGHEKFYLKLKTKDGLAVVPVVMENARLTYSVVDEAILYADGKVYEYMYGHHTDIDLELTSVGDLIFVKEN